MTRSERAAVDFDNHCSCSQAVLAAFAERFGLDQAVARGVSAAFGSGMSRTSQTCGAVSGALMVIGLSCGPRICGDTAAKDMTYAAAQRFMNAFRERFGAVACTTLLGCDLSTEAGRARCDAEGISRERCPQLVKFAVEELERMLQLPNATPDP